jgi:FdhE protein
MASIFGKWLGGNPAPSAELADALADLDKLTQPALAVSRRVLHEVLQALFAEPIVETTPALDGALARQKLTEGTPLLQGLSLALDLKSLRRRWQAVCAAVERQNPEAGAAAPALDELKPSELLSEILAGRSESVHARAEALHLDPALTATLLRLSLFPVLASAAAALEPLRAEASWRQGTCPTCGSWPLLGEFRGLEQTRFLRCGWCAADWEFPRLRCPFCGNHDHRLLGFFHVEGEENRCRAATCEECRRYVKMISTLDRLSAPQLLVTDLATIYLDLAAADRGFHVG